MTVSINNTKSTDNDNTLYRQHQYTTALIPPIEAVHDCYSNKDRMWFVLNKCNLKRSVRNISAIRTNLGFTVILLPSRIGTQWQPVRVLLNRMWQM